MGFRILLWKNFNLIHILEQSLIESVKLIHLTPMLIGTRTSSPEFLSWICFLCNLVLSSRLYRARVNATDFFWRGYDSVYAFDQRGETALTTALGLGYTNTAKSLIARGADVNVASLHLKETPLHLVCTNPMRPPHRFPSVIEFSTTYPLGLAIHVGSELIFAFPTLVVVLILFFRQFGTKIKNFVNTY